MLHSLVIGDLTHVRSLGDLLHSYWNKFFITNGRTSDMVAELFCGLLGKPLFNVFNALMFGLLAHVVSLLATGHRSLLAQTMLYACIGTCYPVPGETMLWLAGSCNYLWTITASLWLLYYMLNHSHRQLTWWQQVLLVLWAMLAGAGNEAMSFGFFGGMVLYYVFNRRQVDRVVLVAMSGYLLGVLLIVASPAAWERASDGGIVVDMPLMALLQSRCYIIGEKMLHFMVPIAAILLGVVALIWKGVKSFRKSVWPYLLVMLTLVVFVLGLNPERPYAPMVTVSLIGVVIVADRLMRRCRLLRLAAIVLCLAIGAYTFARGVIVLRDYKQHDEQVVNEIRSAPSQVILRECPYKGYSRFLYPLPMKSDWFFPNEYTWRAYFDKENVQFVSDSVYERFHSGRLLDGAVEMPFTSNRPAVVGKLVAFPDQDYMLMPLQLDTLPTAYQVGMAFWNDTAQALSSEEQAYRRQHALMSKSDPFGYYPLRYDGKVLMVLPLMSDKVARMEILLDYAGNETVTIYRKGPNPVEVKPVE